MTPRDYQISKLKELQDELRIINKKRNLLKKKIKNQVEVIDTLDDVLKLSKKIKIDYVARDIDLCRDYINQNGDTYTADLIKYLNKELKGQHVRWKRGLDSNTFMGYMGYKLKDYDFKHEKVVHNGRKTTIWLKN